MKEDDFFNLDFDKLNADDLDDMGIGPIDPKKGIINMQGKLGAMYNNLTDIKSRLIFIIDVKKKIAAGELSNNNRHKVKAQELAEYNAIEQDFINRYIVNGSRDVKAMIAQTLGEISAKNKYESYIEYQRNLKVYDDNEDPELIDDVSKFLVQQTGLGMDHLAITEVIAKISNADNSVGIPETISDAERLYYESKKLTRKQIASVNTYNDNRENYKHGNDDEEFETVRSQFLSSDNLDDKRRTDINARRDYIDYHYSNGKETDERSQELYRTEVLNKYASLKTMEERFKFIFDIEALRGAEEMAYGQPLLPNQFVDNMYESFIDTYITNGSLDTVNKVFKELAGINNKETLDLIGEKKKLDLEYSSEGKTGQKKADILLKSTVSGFKRSSFGQSILRKKLTESLEKVDKNNQYCRAAKTLLTKYGINENTTVKEYANAIGITDENELDAYVQKNNVSLDDSAVKIFENKAAEGENVDGLVQMELSFFTEYINHILRSESDKFVSKNRMSEEDKKSFSYINNLFSKEMDISGIEDWYNNEAADKIKALDTSAGKKLINDHKLKYGAKSVGYDQYISLHTGYDAYKADNTKKIDCLAKSVAAVQLKNSGVPFDVKKIRKVAAAIKQTKEFNDFIKNKDAFDIGLSDASSVTKINDRLYSASWAVSADKVSDYIREMSFVSRNMMSKKDRSVQYQAVFDIIKKIGDLREKYDFNQQGDREAAVKEVSGLNNSLINASQNYIKDKEKVRSSTGGNERFKNTLDGLGVMYKYAEGAKPTIDSIVNKINTIRDAKKHPDKAVNISEYGSKRAADAKAERLKKDKSKSKGKAM